MSATVTSQPIRMLVDTHHHRDHTHGNCLLPLATIIGHDAELDGAEPGAPIDTRAALMDMVAFNGGQPLRCLA